MFDRLADGLSSMEPIRAAVSSSVDFMPDIQGSDAKNTLHSWRKSC